MSEVSQDQIRVLISAGEVSGDQHASLVIEELRRAYPQACFKGMGGASLKAAGVDIIVDAQRYGGKNGFNILDILSSSLYAFWTMLTCLWRWKPKLLILVDYPDFNLRLAFFAKLLGVPVLYHIPPKLWAWRTGRIKRIRKSVDKVACIFPFEANFYKDHKYQNAHYVGHPFADEFPKDLDKRRIKEKFCQTYGLDVHQPLVAVFPGSRKSEVLRHLPILSATIELVRQSVPKVQFVVVRGPGLSDELFSSLGTLKGVVVQSNIQIEAMQAADVALLKSGTCNVEAAFCKLPFVCMYTTPKISAWIIRRFVKLTEYSLVNIIRKNTVREIMQEEATPENLAGELLKLITNREEELTRVTQGLFEVEQTLRSNDLESNDQSAARNAALLAAELLELRRPERVLSRLISYLGRYKSQFYLSLFCMVLFGASDGAIPFLVKHILDGVFSEQNENLLYVLPVILIVFAVLRAGVDIGQHFILTRIGHNIVRDIRNDTAQHLLRMSPGFFHRQSSGNLLSHFTSDVVLVRELLTNSVSSLIRDVIRIFALLATAFFLDPFLGIIAFVVFPIGIIPVYRFGKKMRKLSKRGQEAIGSLSALLHQSIIGNKVVKIFGREDYEFERFTHENERLNRTFIKSEFVRAITGPVNELLSIGAISAVILYGGMSVIDGSRTQGDFIAFLLALFLLYDPFKKLSKLNNQVQQGMSGAERIFELLDTEPLITSPATPSVMPSKFAIEFSNVAFAYPGTDQKALSNISLTIPENTKLALVGFSGAGKSTLVDLIPRFVDPSSGTVRIGGTDIRNLSLSELRSQIAMVDQHTFLFQDSIFNNISYGKPQATQEQVEQAARAANAYDFIVQLPQGFETVVGESGLTLSGGERQRIAIARAILKDAPILILDEATASLDNQSEKLVQSALEALEKDRTTVVIAHRLSTVRNADRIIVLEHGQIVESGTHDELLKQNGAFAKLYALQFGEQVIDQENAQYVN